MIEFKITNEARQRFSVQIVGRRVTFTLWYSGVMDRWSLDLAIDNEPVLHGRRVVVDRDLLAPFRYNIGVVFAFSEGGEPPGRDQLPLGLVRLYHTTQGEIDDATVVEES